MQIAKKQRIAKSIAATGYCSRRHADQLILMGGNS